MFRLIFEIPGTFQTCPELPSIATGAAENTFHAQYTHHADTGARWQNLGDPIFFAQPMDRAEVLHAQSYDISGSRKNVPGKYDQVLSRENQTFPLKFYT